MQVYKFGGASVKDAAAVKNVVAILKQYDTIKKVVVVSAMGKTTNALELVVNAYYRVTRHGKIDCKMYWCNMSKLPKICLEMEERIV
jgi:aspartokinase